MSTNLGKVGLVASLTTNATTGAKIGIKNGLNYFASTLGAASLGNGN